MTDTVTAWRPNVPEPGAEGLTVPYSSQQPMTRDLYQDLLWLRLKELIDQNPQEAERVLSRSEEKLPSLYAIAKAGNPKDWPSQILISDQMQMCLARIDWKKTGQTLTLSPSQLPTLEQITEALQ